MTQRVLFVCLGNICRSPTADAVFNTMVKDAGLSASIEVDSAGTGDWHIGHAPDPRTQKAAAQQGYDMSHLRARLVSEQDFHEFDYILAMDAQNLADLEAMKPAQCRATLGLFLDYADGDEQYVPDPYYGGEDGFAAVLSLVERGAKGLLRTLTQKPA